MPSSKRGSPSVLIRVGNNNLLFDTGPGSLRKLLEAGFTYKDIDYLLYTHFHLDHIADLGPFIFASKYLLDLREKDLFILGPPGIKEFYNKLTSFYGKQIQDLNYELKIKELRGNFSTQDWEIHTQSLPHTSESIGYRLKDKRGKVIVYSGDTEYCESLIKLSKDADLLILECSFSEKVPGHLYPEVIGKVAKEAGAKWLVLTHIYPVCDNYDLLSPVKKVFSGKITIAEDLMKIKI